MKVSRNDPCPCGSGRKYKKCHLAADEAAYAAEHRDHVSPLHELDHEVVRKMFAFALRRLGDELDAPHVFPGLEGDDSAPQFVVPWAVYGALMDGRTIAAAFLDAQAWSLTAGEREWLEAQQQSWYSLYEVLEVDGGRGLRLRDLLTGSERFVHEVKGSTSAVPHLIMLCRVVEVRGIAVIAGLYPQPLGPLEGKSVHDAVRTALRRKRAPVSAEVLRQPETARMIAELFDSEVDRLRHRPAPEVRNTDGDKLLLITKRYTFAPSQRPDIEAALSAAKFVRHDEDIFILLRRKDRTLLGSVSFVGKGGIQLDANSTERMRHLDEILIDACGEWLTESLGSVLDPQSHAAEESPLLDSFESGLDYKRHYYHEEWMKNHIPMLDGKTPRQAARSKRGREMLDALLKHIELGESQLPEEERFDVTELRARLGMT